MTSLSASLVSPTDTVHAGTASSVSTGHARKHSRANSHSASSRRSSHAHVVHRSSTSSGTRRGSEGESGRRALVAGLTMHALDAPKPRRSKTVSERPLAKSSRSDTHLPRLTRVNSRTSNTSHASHTSHQSHASGRRRSGAGLRVRSDETIEVVGQDGAVVSGEDGEGWESGEDDGAAGREARKSHGAEPHGVQRAASDSVAQTSQPSLGVPEHRGALVGSPTPMPPKTDHHAPEVHRTTGFGGTSQVPDASILQAQHVAVDRDHVAPAFQVRHRSSAANLATGSDHDSTTSLTHKLDGVTLVESEKDIRGTADDERRLSGGSGQKESETDAAHEQRPAPQPEQSQPAEGPHRMRSTEGSGLPTKDTDAPSPAFPFPAMPLGSQPQQEEGSHSAAADDRASSYAQHRRQQSRASEYHFQSAAHDNSTSGDAMRARIPSAPHRAQTLRHRPSHSSLRSVQSLRAPPHPLNSPTGLRSGASTALNSPTHERDRKRVSSMHYPPAAPAVVYRETATGHGWDGDEDDEDEDGGPAPLPGTPTRAATASSIRDDRGSFSSVRGLRDILGAQGHGGTHVNGPNGHARPAAARRVTALEAASAASRLHSTTDPVAYHQSLGFSSSTAETAHLLSRFLPPKRQRRPRWAITMREAVEGPPRVGLADGQYRAAHESLVRTMRELGVGRDGARARAQAHRYADDVSVVKGGKAVKHGDWAGKTPLELSVERCLAQRPPRIPGL